MARRFGMSRAGRRGRVRRCRVLLAPQRMFRLEEGHVCSAPGDLFLGSEIRAGWSVGDGVEIGCPELVDVYPIRLHAVRRAPHHAVGWRKRSFSRGNQARPPACHDRGQLLAYRSGEQRYGAGLCAGFRIWRAPPTTLTSGLGSFPLKTSARIAPISWSAAFSRSQRISTRQGRGFG